MVSEKIFIGRNNSFSLQLLRADEPINLLAITGYELNLSNGLQFTDQTLFKEKENGIVEITIGHLLTEDDLGTHIAHLVTYDLSNADGIRWPNFKLKVQA